MTGILMRIFGAGINALAFAETYYTFSKSGRGAAETERKFSKFNKTEI